MLNKEIVTEIMLFNHFEGKSEPLQKKVIESWLEEPKNQDRYYETFEKWLNKNSLFVPDDGEAYKKIIHRKEVASNFEAKNWVKKMLHFRIAVAAILIFIVCGGLFLGKDILLYKTIKTAYGETKTLVLPDSSVVILNANTKIQFARFGFGIQERLVLLNGEADFSVVHKINNLPFLVKTANNLEVKVLGTKFNVYARDAQANVVLKEGSVALKHQENKVVKNELLHPGDLFTSDSKTGKSAIHRLKNTENVTAWKHQDFVFEALRFSEIAQVFKDEFGVEVKFQNNALASTVISGTVHASSSDELIEAIAFLLEINYKVDKNTVYFFD